jgi:hypothetical protein
MTTGVTMRTRLGRVVGRGHGRYALIAATEIEMVTDLRRLRVEGQAGLSEEPANRSERYGMR